MRSRRDFLRLAAALAAAGVLAPGCASVVAVRVRPVDGRVRLDPAEHPGLAGPGGFLRLQPDGFSAQVYVLSTEGGYAALSPICTHLGCTVEIQGARLECPCHGSTYDRGGRVLRGPAERPLRSFPVRSHPDGTIEIDLTSGGSA
ncbi:MAG TPA: Rieske (2Fe-2S) protein [Longimicrobiales bacterium]|nr:Rieske (2Fe-2S) protein [Longimicrobiales bacterium]